MSHCGVLNDGKQITYAFGLHVGQYRGLKTITHGGGWAGFRTCVMHFPEQRFSVVVLMNYTPADPDKAAYDIADIYLVEELKSLGNMNNQERLAPVAIDIPNSVLNEYVGSYQLGAAWYLTITRDGNNLLSSVNGENAVPMTAQSDSTFQVSRREATIKFERDDTGRVMSLFYVSSSWHWQHSGMTCPKLEDISTLRTAQLNEFTGEYISEELKTTYIVALENGKLVMTHKRHGTINLKPVWKDYFWCVVWFMKSIEFYRDEEEKVAGFIVTQGRNRNLRFIRR